jgi:hypothetical protein
MKKKSRTIFIWDIHWCFEELNLLIKKLDISKDDSVYLTWDLILKGPSSMKVLKFVKKNWYKWVKWNKEYEILQSIKTKNYSNSEEKKLCKKLTKKYPELLAYIKSTPYLIEEDDFILVHAWLLPHIEISKQDPETLCYIREYNNAPWYIRYDWAKKIVYWHRALNGLQLRHNTIWIDSWCVYWGKLTAYVLETWEIIQQKALKIYKNPYKRDSLKYYSYALSYYFSKMIPWK